MEIFLAGRNSSFLYKTWKKGFTSLVQRTLLSRLAGFLLAFGLQVMIARMMGVIHFGEYIVILTVLNIFLGISLFGFEKSSDYFLPAFMEKKEYAAVKGFARFSSRFVLLVSLICSVLIFMFLVYQAKKFHIGFSEGIFWALLTIPFLALMYQSLSILRTTGGRAMDWMVTMLLPVITGFCLTWYYLSHGKLSIDAIMLIMLCCTALISIVLSRRAKMFVTSISDRAVMPERRWLSVSFGFFIIAFSGVLFKSVDIIMTAILVNYKSAGMYAIAVQLAAMTILGLTVVRSIYLDRLTDLHDKKQLLKMQKLISTSSLQTLSISMPIAFLLIVFGKRLLGLFGEPFTDAYLPMVILLLSSLISSFTGMVNGLMIKAYPKTLIFFLFLTLAIQVILNLLLIPALGILGAATGSAISVILLNVFSYSFIRRRLHIRALVF